MLNWMRRRRPISYLQRDAQAAPQHVMSGKYLMLYQYLQDRYADTVVLTFGQIESLLGFALPDQARRQQQWWTNTAAATPGTNYSDSWILASRIATPNLLARTVAFERMS
jgi:hypothetical protein